MKQHSRKGMNLKQWVEQHSGIILEALRDYSKWWADEPENERVKEIDRAIEYLEWL